VGPKKPKQPFVATAVPRQEPRAANDPAEVRGRHPVWRVKCADLEGPFGWKRASQHDLLKIFSKLKDFETMTWREIECVPSNGYMETASLGKEAQSRLREIGRDTQDTLFKLRVTQAGRLWGVRYEHVFDFLWWDPEHQVYPMNIADN
jgi:hypothetical protein